MTKRHYTALATVALAFAVGFLAAKFDLNRLFAAPRGISPGGKYMPSLPDPSDLKPINGIDPRSAKRFWERWHLVTSRYRRDTNQTRFIFANDIAWDAMSKRLRKYPDGSMFAKATFESAPDSVFPASIIPKRYVELQMMKKDSRAYPNSDGWGYGLWHYLWAADTSGQIEMVSCHACHSLVRDRDFIFAIPAFLLWSHGDDPSLKTPRFEERFVETPVSAIPEFGKKVINYYGNKDIQTVKLFKIKSMNTGHRISLGSVAQFTFTDGIPHLMLGETDPTFLLTVPIPESEVGEPTIDGRVPPHGPCVRFAMTEHSRPDLVNLGYVCGSTVSQERKYKTFSSH